MPNNVNHHTDVSKKILITGATGYIGTNLCDALLKKNYDIHALVRSQARNKNPHITVHPLDLMDREKVASFLAQNRFETLVHLAWYVGPKCQISPLNIDWLESSLHLIKTFWENGGKTVLVSGSMSEYDFSYGWCTENKTPLNSPSLYGQTKAALYQILEKFCKFHPLNLKWARIFNIYGLNEKKTRLIPYVINAMLNGEEVNVSHCCQMQNYLHITDVAEALVRFLESNATGAVNIAADTPVRLKDMLEICKREIGYPKAINYGALAPSFEQIFLSGDISRLKNDIGWKQRVDLETGLKETVRYWKGQRTH